MKEEYYKMGNYVDYLTRYPRYQSIAKDIMKLIPDIGPVLDFGCGVGFLTKAFQELGVEADGYDISEWAINYGSKDLGVKNLSTKLDYKKAYRTRFMLDVLEYIDIDHIRESILFYPTYKYLVVRIPVPLRTGEDFHMEVSRNDKTHITCLDKTDWDKLFRNCDLMHMATLNYENIWDSPGVFCAVYEVDDRSW